MLKKLNNWLKLSLFVASGIIVATPAFADQPAGPGFGGTLLLFAPMFAVIWLMVLRPQQKRLRDQQDTLKSLQKGDEVVTSSGILGKITGITEKVVTLEVADNVRVKMLKSQISQVIKGQIKDLA
jgi:preprotein translocase subunit YajC